MGLKKKKLWRCFRPDSENIAPRFNNHRKLFRIGAKRACINKAREDGRRIKPTDRRCCLKGFWFDYFALPFLVAGGLRVVPRVVPQAGFAVGEPSCPQAYIHNGDARASRHAHVAPCKGLCALQHQKNSGLVGLLSRLLNTPKNGDFFRWALPRRARNSYMTGCVRLVGMYVSCPRSCSRRRYRAAYPLVRVACLILGSQPVVLLLGGVQHGHDARRRPLEQSFSVLRWVGSRRVPSFVEPRNGR